MMKNMTVTELIADTVHAMKPLQYQSSTQYRFQVEFQALSDYYHGDTLVSLPLLTEYLQAARQRYETQHMSLVKFRRLRRAITMLEQCYLGELLPWKRLPPWPEDCPQNLPFAAQFAAYGVILQTREYSPSTVKGYQHIAHCFLTYLRERGLSHVGQLSRTHVREFLPYMATSYQPSSMSAVLTGLRAFLSYLHDQHGLSSDVIAILPTQVAHKIRVVPTMTAENEGQLLAVIDRETAIGKRDWAMVLLALRTGLRTVDIIHLQLENIDWRKSTLSIVQHKTQRALILPVLPDVGNALVDYLLHSRPPSDCRCLFLRAHAPYIGFANPYGCSDMVNRYLKKAGIRQEPGDQGGAHWFRYALATRLLRAETPIPLIASILGHSQQDSTRPYLSRDDEHLRACALGLDGIEVEKKG